MAFEQPLPKSLSPSRLADFQACPRRYQYASVERIAQPASYATAKGRFVHYIFEHLFKLEAANRTIAAARSFVGAARENILTPQVREEIALDEEVESRMLAETDAIIERYFTMEDPRAITSEGVELRVGVTIDDTPLFGILDRLDRDDEGNLVIVDYKTGALPNRNYDAHTFANAELYAVLCEEKLHERPTKIRLLYVSQGETIEKNVSDVVIKARASAATSAWKKIRHFYDDGIFPATPSKNACRFCSFYERCREAGVPVAPR
ncbi:MAG: PD-(D/E)XK nuclease family protein [Acidimicrobiaceae bacterium]|nr:PD-(D/E)XK nuclease family protein [Acidimicrobiaceae bacterium]